MTANQKRMIGNQTTATGWRVLGSDPDAGTWVEERRLFPNVSVQLTREPDQTRCRVSVHGNNYVNAIGVIPHATDDEATAESMRAWAESQAIAYLTEMHVLADKALRELKNNPTDIKTYDKNKIVVTLQTHNRQSRDALYASSYVMTASELPDQKTLKNLFRAIVLDDIRETPAKLRGVRKDPNYKVTWQDVHRLPNEAFLRHGLRRYDVYKDNDANDATVLTVLNSLPFDLSSLRT